ncbi:YqiA/YcfP family alpha/beta fold hydrolase [Listeria booriae]|uniref:Two component regulator three Y domain-containing protein n=1 Tax=Listeria booriae TaxID=1552123 RepID=A0A842A3G2_9LIST|nr:YqiA/YcfP family alpha/beta fold hydrolase [Listeria booriae]MBC1566373.1 Two component regulator three Y domain-containing protein [Listeria booriae]
MIKKTLAKLYFQAIGKTATQSNGVKMHYLFQKDTKSHDLIVVFSAFPGAGMSSTYNYVNTLKETPGNKLFILDDFGFEKRGVYYLCEAGDFKIRDAVEELITAMTQKVRATQTTFIGSSKGGYAALYFGFRLGATNVISGAPQYFIGKYLQAEAGRVKTLESMLGGISEVKITQLDAELATTITQTAHTPKLYMHYSTAEHTYKSHIAPLLAQLADEQILAEQDIEQYASHMEVRHYFPLYLKKTLTKIRGEQS